MYIFVLKDKYLTVGESYRDEDADGTKRDVLLESEDDTDKQLWRIREISP